MKAMKAACTGGPAAGMRPALVSPTIRDVI